MGDHGGGPVMMPRSPHDYRLLDRVIRKADAMRGRVVATETHRVAVEWEDGSVTPVERFDHAVVIEEFGPGLSSDDVERTRIRLLGLKSDLDDILAEIAQLESVREELEQEITELGEVVRELDRAKSRISTVLG